MFYAQLMGKLFVTDYRNSDIICVMYCFTDDGRLIIYSDQFRRMQGLNLHVVVVMNLLN